jgi:hypothetical protein
MSDQQIRRIAIYVNPGGQVVRRNVSANAKFFIGTKGSTRKVVCVGEPPLPANASKRAYLRVVKRGELDDSSGAAAASLFCVCDCVCDPGCDCTAMCDCAPDCDCTPGDCSSSCNNCQCNCYCDCTADCTCACDCDCSVDCTCVSCDCDCQCD